MSRTYHTHVIEWVWHLIDCVASISVTLPPTLLNSRRMYHICLEHITPIEWGECECECHSSHTITSKLASLSLFLSLYLSFSFFLSLSVSLSLSLSLSISLSLPLSLTRALSLSLTHTSAKTTHIKIRHRQPPPHSLKSHTISVSFAKNDLQLKVIRIWYQRTTPSTATAFTPTTHPQCNWFHSLTCSLSRLPTLSVSRWHLLGNWDWHDTTKQPHAATTLTPAFNYNSHTSSQLQHSNLLAFNLQD